MHFILYFREFFSFTGFFPLITHSIFSFHSVSWASFVVPVPFTPHYAFHLLILTASTSFLVSFTVTHSPLPSSLRSSGVERDDDRREETSDMTRRSEDGGRGSFTQPLVLSSRVFHLLPSPRRRWKR